MLKLKRSIQSEFLESARSYPVVTIIGPRQSGKTTLAKTTFANKAYVNLEIPEERALATSDPKRFLRQFPDGAILDEIQRVPQLLSYIQAIVDGQEKNGLFILTGSHQLELQQEITQSLAGRTGMLKLLPLSLAELRSTQAHFSLEQQIYYGGYPRIYKNNISPKRFYRDYVQTYVERDVKKIINIKDLDQFQRLLNLCAARVGQVIDYTSMANELGIARDTVKSWLSVLKASFLITTLPPYFENFGKRIIKTPKLYFTDVGLVSYLLGIQEFAQIARHPLRGQLFENLVLLELMKLHYNRGDNTQFYYYRDNHQNEIDILFQQGLHLNAVEIKSTETFNKNLLKSLKKFEHIAEPTNIKPYLIYAGEREQQVNTHQIIQYLNIDDYF